MAANKISEGEFQGLMTNLTTRRALAQSAKFNPRHENTKKFISFVLSLKEKNLSVKQRSRLRELLK
ncbi:MAG: hypothetical protein ACE5HX_01525 [bacterium]